ncbi:MAG: hypothetical protein EHM15_05035 [Desulfobacteraceae bacterium]|nr:MAG: hypothetical protein EHM15_05035 [Desulfobacteraceae bacterium]
MVALAGTWIHEGDPLRVLKLDEDLEAVRREVAQGRFFERKIKDHLLDNPHRVRLTLVPDPRLSEEREACERQDLEAIARRLSPADLDRLRSDAVALRRLQDTVEDVACLPTLERGDIPPAVEVITAHAVAAEGRIAVYDQATSGILYVAAAAGAGGLPEELGDLAPFFCHAFSRIGTSLRDYADMARRIDAATGGMGLAVSPRTGFDGGGECIPFVSLNAKCLNRNLSPTADILAELLGQYSFSDLARLKSLLLEYRAGLESMVVHNGHRLAMSLAARHLSTTRLLSERWSGIHHLRHVKELTDGLSEMGLADLAARLSEIGRQLWRKPNFRVALIGEADALADACTRVGGIADGLAAAGNGAGFSYRGASSTPTRVREGWTTATAVNFVAAAFPVVRLEHADAPALAVIAKMLRSLYLHREIREKGGAYGGFAVYNPEDGVFSLASYRDPQLAATLDVFARSGEFIRSGNFDDNDIKEAILQVCAEIDKPDPPGPAARKAFYRQLVNLSDALRLQFKERLIGLSRTEVQAAAERYFGNGLTHASVAVIAGEESLRAANAELSEPLEVHKI